MAAVTIRKATEADAEAIWRIHTSCIEKRCSSHYSTEEVRCWAARQQPENYVQFIQKDHFVVAETNDKRVVAGFGHLGESDPKKIPQGCGMEVKALYVSPEAQGEGVGRLLLGELEKEAKSCGCTCLGVCSTLNAVPFYQSCGFVLVGETMHCVGSHSLQCQIMRKQLERES